MKHDGVTARGIHHFRAISIYGLCMARPKVYDEPRVTTALRLPESLHTRLRSTADERDVSVNLIATKAIKEYLDQLERMDLPETA